MGMPLTKVPEGVSKSVRRKLSFWRAIRQWRPETVGSSMHIGLEESRPIDKGTEKRNSDFPRGPLSAKSLGCTGKSCQAAYKKPPGCRVF